MRKVIHELSDSELEEITGLYEKKMALENLVKIIDANGPSFEVLYNRLISDYGEVSRKFEAWWRKMHTTYNWPNGNWSVDFEAAEIVQI